MKSFTEDFYLLNKKRAAKKKYDALAMLVIDKYQVHLESLILLLESEKLSREVVGKVMLRCLSLKTQWTYVGQFMTGFNAIMKEMRRVGFDKACHLPLMYHFLQEGDLMKAKEIALMAKQPIPPEEMDRIFRRALMKEDYETALLVVEETNSFDQLQALTRKLATYNRQLAQCPIPVHLHIYV